MSLQRRTRAKGGPNEWRGFGFEDKIRHSHLAPALNTYEIQHLHKTQHRDYLPIDSEKAKGMLSFTLSHMAHHVCCLCDRTGIHLGNSKFFCSKHRNEAIEAQRQYATARYGK